MSFLDKRNKRKRKNPILTKSHDLIFITAQCECWVLTKPSLIWGLTEVTVPLQLLCLPLLIQILVRCDATDHTSY